MTFALGKVNGLVDANGFGIWSPHRGAHAVLAWKSLLSFRSEPWYWCDDADSASWWIVDVAHHVPPELTLALRHRPHVRGIVMARDFGQLPDPIWQFFKTPLQMERITHWLDQLMQSKEFAAYLRRHNRQRRLPSDLHQQQVHLTRWPNLTRYGAASLALTETCAQLLQGWRPAQAVLSTTKAAFGSGDLITQLLQDCWAEGSLELRSVAFPSAPFETLQSSFQKNKSLLKRLWGKFL